ncbi:MAG: nuclear transport factor 2 family protein [Chloroflexota bacterium]|nr:MAG: nuclear transport factor 2 family protein [Chloroflexota bacterium]
MNDDEMVARISELYGSGDMEAFGRELYALTADDVVLEYPQSGERFRGRERIMEMNMSYEGSTGTAPKPSLRRVLKPGQAWVIEGTIDYGDGTPVSAISIIEFDGGKVVHQTDYFANPFPAPDWRKPYREG